MYDGRLGLYCVKVQCTTYVIHCTSYIERKYHDVHRTLHTIRRTLGVQCTIYGVHFMTYGEPRTMYGVHTELRRTPETGFARRPRGNDALAIYTYRCTRKHVPR